mmetsp:Transcript_3093/g.5370  ORF Transcript_3093/g.5370 Transcript_3093/m.5370 type:complete len:150 (+) Transcript_3093:140-589(+)
MRMHLAHHVLASFELEPAQGDAPPPGPPQEECTPNRPALVTKAACPAVGPQLAIERKESSDICPPQPPACCESAKRAEHSVKMIEKMTGQNVLLKLFNMTSGKNAAPKAAAAPCLLALLGPSPEEFAQSTRIGWSSLACDKPTRRADFL